MQCYGERAKKDLQTGTSQDGLALYFLNWKTIGWLQTHLWAGLTYQGPEALAALLG